MHFWRHAPPSASGGFFKIGDKLRGDAESARLLAELCQEACDEDEAAKWWYKAAAMGCEHAIDYVTEYRP